MTPLLFVYGTLRPGSPHPMARWLARVAECRGAARFRGQVYGVGAYPGAIHGVGGAMVRGDLLRLRAPSVLRRLDRYEGAEYARVRARVTGADGQPRVAWIYLYRRSTSGWRRLRSGDWFSPAPG